MQAQLFSLQSFLDFAWFIVLLLMFLHFWRVRRALLRTHSWLMTQGWITHCEWTSQGHRLWPKIEYVYEVGEQEFTGEHLFPDTCHNNPNSHYARQVAYKVAEAYKNDEPITVYYNPALPEQAALDVKVPRKINLILILLGIFTSVHLLFFLFKYLL